MSHCDYPVYAELYDFKSREFRSLGFFVLASRSDAVSILVCSTSHTYAHYLMAQNRMLVGLLILEIVGILAFSDFSGYGYLQMA